MKGWGSARWGAALLFVATTGAAQSSYYASPRGGRSALLGNTGVALGRDGAAAFTNPATLIGIEDARVAFSVDFYRFSHRSFDNWYRPSQPDPRRFADMPLEGASYVDNDFDSLPSTLCLFLPGGGRSAVRHDAPTGTPYTLGACLGDLERSELRFLAQGRTDQRTDGLTQQTVTVARRVKRFYVGPTGALQFGPYAFGLSVMLTQTRLANAMNASVTATRGDAVAVSTMDGAINGTSFDLIAILGATAQFENAARDARTTVGVSLHLPGAHLTGSKSAELVRSSSGSLAGAAPPDQREQLRREGSLASGIPLRLALGAGWSDERTTLEFNTTISTPARRLHTRGEQTVVRTAGGVSNTETTATEARFGDGWALDLGFGAERRLSTGLSVLSGIGTDIGALFGDTLPSDPLALAQERLARVGASLGVAARGDSGELTVGLVASYLWGRVLAPDVTAATPTATPVSASGVEVLLVIGGSTSFRQLTAVAKDLLAVPGKSGGKPASK